MIEYDSEKYDIGFTLVLLLIGLGLGIWGFVHPQAFDDIKVTHADIRE